MCINIKNAYFLVGIDALYTFDGFIAGLDISLGLFFKVFDCLLTASSCFL
jgi:hypothetical protein